MVNQHEDILMGTSLWRSSARSSPTFHPNIPSPTPSPAPSIRLEHFRNRQEAAISFEDDLEFNPSLTPEELNEARRELNEARRNTIAALSHPPLPPSSPPRVSRPSRASSPVFSPTRAIPIIDPANRIPLSLPTMSKISPPQQYPRQTSVSASTTGFSSIFSPSQSTSVNPYSPPPIWASAWDLKPQQPRLVANRSLPIVDPNNRSILNASPERRAFYGIPTQQRMGGAGPAGWFDVAVR